MISSVLDSIDLNPIIATLGEGIGDVLNSTGDAVSGLTDGLTKRDLSYELEHNILYSTNNYRANKHRNLVLEQNGDIVAYRLDNDGNALGQRIVGDYKSDMTFTGEEFEVERDGETVTVKEYIYRPQVGVYSVCGIEFDSDGDVVGTQILADVSAGGSSTLGNQ
jgi:hypothetical protein